MVAVRGRDMEDTLFRPAVATEMSVGRIERLELSVPLPKTEAIVFGGPGWTLPEDLTIAVAGRAEAIARGERLYPEEAEREQRQAVERLKDRWKNDLEDSSYGVRSIGALLPSFDQWLYREHGVPSYMLTQVMTGHGCFGHYLHEIKREPTTICHECGYEDDTAQHTLESCRRWAVEHQNMVVAAEITSGDLSLHNVMSAMLRSKRTWKEVEAFCETVIFQKEAAERLREDSADAPPLRRRRRGRRRRQYALANS
ncbi:uncharacterized protein LOC133526627 [Cydia pomonella]|uniref:uncharacterized protein LOC133526627 n=1 Tax=Cydia pomonella TaxID=82600 RepID=UPI002ADD3F9C|nr:uncharacterized protein LOC133526627 [Cydia pomonella]